MKNDVKTIIREEMETNPQPPVPAAEAPVSPKKPEPPIDVEFKVISSPSKPEPEKQQTPATKGGKESLWRKLLTWDGFWRYVIPSANLAILVGILLFLLFVPWQAPSIPSSQTPGVEKKKEEQKKGRVILPKFD